MSQINNQKAEIAQSKNDIAVEYSTKRLKESQVKIATKNDIKESILIENTKKKKVMLIIAVAFISLAIITALILIIGHLGFSWFKSKESLVINRIREENLVSRYSEAKKSVNYYNYEGVDENQQIQSHSIDTDFIVGLSKKERVDKIYDFKNIDYLYESYILVINITHSNETDSMFIGGMNIYDEEKSVEELLEMNNAFIQKYLGSTNNTQINIPFAKFYFYENGTLDKIYFPEGMNDFYKTLIKDLIQKITPKLSKSLYKDQNSLRRLEEGKEGTYLNYEEITKNGKYEKTLIYEDKIEKNSENEKDELTQENKQINSKTIRTFNSMGDMTHLELEGEASFITSRVEPKQEKKVRVNEEIGDEINSQGNQTDFKLGFDEFKLKAKSNMQLIKSGLEPKTLNDLKHLAELIKLELYQEKKSLTYTEETKGQDEKDINENIDKKPKRNLAAAASTLNFPFDFNQTCSIVYLSFLGFTIDLRQRLYINKTTGLRKNNLELQTGSKVRILGSASLYQYHDSTAKNISKDLMEYLPDLSKKFDALGYLVNVGLHLKLSAVNGIYANITKNVMYVKGYESVIVGVTADIGLNLLIVSFGVRVIGNVAKGSQYILANTIINQNKVNIQVYRVFNSCSVDLELYFSIWILFWKKTFSTKFNIYKGFSLYNKYNEIIPKESKLVMI